MTDELLAGLALVLVLVGVALFYAWRQVCVLSTLRRDPAMAADDRRHFRRQGIRRLLSSLLMLLLAGLLLGGFFFERPQAVAADAPATVRVEAENAVRLYTGYWICALLVVLAFLGLAVIDLWATARYGFRHQRQLEQDRRTMLKEEASRIRRWRSEMN